MRWKWFVGIFTFLIIALMVTVYAVLVTYDYNKLKPRVAQLVKDATGRELHLGGEIKLAIGFSPSLVVTDVALANASWGSQPQMITVQKLQAQARLLPLLYRNVEVKNISLAGVELLLENDPNGKGNWDFIAGDRKGKSAETFKPTEIDIDKIHIENLRFIFHNGKTGSKRQYTLTGLDVARRESADELTLGLKADYDSQPITLSGKIGRVRNLFARQRFPLNLSGTFSDTTVKVAGAIDDLPNLTGIDLKIDASGQDLSEIGPIIGQELPKTDQFALKGQLTGSAKALSLKEAQGIASRGSLQFTANGAVKDLLNLSGIDLHSRLTGKDLAEVGVVIQEELPATDEFEIQGRLIGSIDMLGLKGARGSGRHGSLQFTANGTVKDLLTLRGMDLNADLKGKNLEEFGEIIGEKLPATDQFEIQGRLTGSTEALTLQTAQGSGRRGSLRITVNGAVKDLLTLRGMDLQSRLAGKDLAEVGPIIDRQLPATDQFAVQGRLTGSAKALSLREAQGSASRGSVNVVLNGRIKDLVGMSGMDLKLKGSGKDLTEIGTIIGQKLPATDKFAVEIRLTGSAKSLSLQQAKGSANRGSLDLTLSGGIEELPALNGINFKVKATGKELAQIGPLVGAELPELGPFDANAKLSGSAKAILLSPFSANIDKSDFKGLVKVEVRKRPKITAHLESSVVDFTTLMKSFEKNQQKPADKAKQKSRLFSDAPLPLDLLKKVDADILLKARNIHAKDARFAFGHLTLKLEDHDFSIDKLEATYKKTKISGSLNVDPGSPPQVSTNFLVQNFNLGEFLKEMGKSDQVRAIVDIAAHGKSKGDSVQSLMANLDGAIGVVMGEGYLTKYLDMLSSGLTEKVFQVWKPHKAVDQIKCVVVQFDIKAGVAASQAFIFDTQAGILAGEGNINLGTEKIDFLLVPKPAHPDLSILTNLRVSGSVIDPHVGLDKASTLTQSAKALSFLAVGPLGLLAPFVHLGANKSHPCDVPSIGQLGLKTPAKK
jgi:uncharacterized protein involved in outer membrane biogenesis